MNYKLVYAKQAQKDAKNLRGSHLAEKAKELLKLIAKNPFASPPPFESLTGDLKTAYSRRLNIQHRLVYEVLEDKKVVKVLRLWTHYE